MKVLGVEGAYARMSANVAHVYHLNGLLIRSRLIAFIVNKYPFIAAVIANLRRTTVVTMKSAYGYSAYPADGCIFLCGGRKDTPQKRITDVEV